MVFDTCKFEIVLKKNDQKEDVCHRIVEGVNEIYTSLISDHSREYCPLEFGNVLPDLTKIYLASVVFIRSKSGHILMTQRCSNLSFPDSWVAPGGKVDPGETFLNAAVREISEEVNIEILPSSLEPVLFYESTSEKIYEADFPRAKTHIFVMFYICKLNKETSPLYGHLEATEIPVKIQETEVQAFEWVHEKELFELLEVSDENEHELVQKYGQHRVSNFGGLNPNKHNRGVPEGHYLAFLRYYQDQVISKSN